MRRRTPLTQMPVTKGHCRWCSQRVSGRRRTWCSDACVQAYLFEKSSSLARRAVWQRDHGVCSLCGVDVMAIAIKLRLWDKALRHQRDERARHCYRVARHVERFIGPWVAQGFKIQVDGNRLRWRALWEADHILPVIEGGPTTMENLRTLCRPCHLAETAKLAARRAEARRPQLRLIGEHDDA